MKRPFVIILCIAALSFLSGCSAEWPDNAVAGWDRLVNNLSKSQITSDDDMIGKRTVTGNDYYTGTYSAVCENAEGRDVVFGGASVYEKKLKVMAKIKTVSGTATVRIRLGSEVEEHVADEEGNLALELELGSGNIYIMIDYASFTGEVNLTCEYAADFHSPQATQ